MLVACVTCASAVFAAPPDDWTDLTPPIDAQAALDAINEAAQPPGENRWDEYVAIMTAFDAIEMEMVEAADGGTTRANFLWLDKNPEWPSDPKEDRLAQRIVQRAEREGLFARYLQLAEGDFRLQGSLTVRSLLARGSSEDHVKGELHFLWSLTTTVRLAQRNEQYDEAVDRLVAAWRVNERRVSRPNFFTAVTARSGHKRLADTTNALVVPGNLSEAQLNRLAGAVPIAEVESVRRTLYVEWLNARHTLTKTMRDPDEETNRASLVESMSIYAGIINLHRKRENRPDIAEFTVNTLPILEHMLEVVDGRVQRAIQEAVIVRSHRDASNPFVQASDGDQLIMSLVSHTSTVPPSVDEMIMSLDGTRLLIAIELYRSRNHRPPRSLDDLVPDFIPLLPVDRLHGNPYGYRRLVKPDDYGRDFLLYCYGWDGVDHRGNEDRTMNQDMLMPYDLLTDMNLDYIFNEVGRYLR